MAKWIKLMILLILIAVLLFVAWTLIRGAGAILGGAGEDSGESDPMFAEETVLPTRPPEMDAQQTQSPHDTLDDYVADVQTPVDKTADELAEEARRN